MDYEYEHEEPYEARILWGRIGVFAGAIVLAFILGSCVGGGEYSQSDVEELNQRIKVLTEENIALEGTISELSASGTADRPRVTDPADTEDGTDEDGAGGDAEDGEDGSGDGSGATTYTVEAGDTLYAIAEKVYGDGSQFRAIAEANGIDTSNRLTVGQELTIPPED